MDVSIQLQEELIKAIAELSSGRSWTEHPVLLVMVTGLASAVTVFIQRWFDLCRQKQDAAVQKQLGIQTLQIEALGRLMPLVHAIDPGPEPFVGADEHEWLDPKVHALTEFVRRMHEYLGSDGHLLPRNVREDLQRAIRQADKHKQGVESGGEGYEATDDDKKGLIEVHGVADEALEKFKHHVGISAA